MEKAQSMPLAGAPVMGEPLFNVLLAYEDTATRTHALRVFQQLIGDCGELFTSVPSAVKLGTLPLSRLCERLTEGGGKTDLVLIAAHQGSAWLRAVKDWLQPWRCRKENQGSVVVTLVDAS